METKDKYKNARAFIVLLAALITWLLDKIRNMEEVKEVDMEEAPPEEEGTDAQNHV